MTNVGCLNDNVTTIMTNGRLRTPRRFSPRRMAAVHAQIRACHEGARIRKQEDCCCSELLGLAQPSEHILRRPIRPPIRIPLEQFLNHSGHNITRRYRVHPDPILAPLRS